MRELKLFDRTQPQTLQIGVLLLYLNAALALLTVLFGGGISLVFLILDIVLPIGGAYGVANSRKLGYYAALLATGIPLLLLIYYVLTVGLSVLFGAELLNVIITVVLFALFIHPHSRMYAKTWFH
ncbi:hypothetical protein [Ferrimicrobium sp.]|uniref:hypothetical protein n=1 Tax=Ferrimicrobium sp. TaxID=2926050 RepID=UPI002614EE7B|nr:hypothetical protein [Ferrimicrobium sp.]